VRAERKVVGRQRTAESCRACACVERKGDDSRNLFSGMSSLNKSENKKAAGAFSTIHASNKSRFFSTSVTVVFIGSLFAVAGAQSVWTTAQLSLGRYALAAASVGNISIFAGGLRYEAGSGEL
jgi:hypothetical protein